MSSTCSTASAREPSRRARRVGWPWDSLGRRLGSHEVRPHRYRIGEASGASSVNGSAAPRRSMEPIRSNSGDVGRIWRAAEGPEYGTVGITEGVVSTAEAPFAIKKSRIGRQGFHHGGEEYLEMNSMLMPGAVLGPESFSNSAERADNGSNQSPSQDRLDRVGKDGPSHMQTPEGRGISGESALPHQRERVDGDGQRF